VKFSITTGILSIFGAEKEKEELDEYDTSYSKIAVIFV